MFDISEKASEATPLQAELHRRHKEARERIASAGAKASERRKAALANVDVVAELRPTARRQPSPPSVPLQLQATRIIQDFICQRSGVDRFALISQSRGKWVTGPRFVAMYLMRSVLGLSTTRIGALFGGRDHTTVLHAVSNIARRCDRDPQFASNIAAMQAEIRKLIDAKPVGFGRYVLHHDVAAYELLGWQTRAPLHDHGILMVWLCDCPMREPLLA